MQICARKIFSISLQIVCMMCIQKIFRHENVHFDTYKSHKSKIWCVQCKFFPYFTYLYGLSYTTYIHNNNNIEYYSYAICICFRKSFIMKKYESTGSTSISFKKESLSCKRKKIFHKLLPLPCMKNSEL